MTTLNIMFYLMFGFGKSSTNIVINVNKKLFYVKENLNLG